MDSTEAAKQFLQERLRNIVTMSEVEILEAMSEFATKEAREFAEWAVKNTFRTYSNDNIPNWLYKGEFYTTAELYNMYKERNTP